MNGDMLLGVLGRGVEELEVQDCLARFARGMEPELDPDDDEDLADWIKVNEIGLELGFEDEAYVKAWDEGLRRQGRLLLTQLYFYGDTEDTNPYPYALPLGLSFDDNQSAVTAKLSEFEATRHSYIRDTWRLPKFDLTVAYRADGLLESVFCQLPCAPWPPLNGGGPAQRFGPDDFVRLFGLRWSDPNLRSALAKFGIERKVAEIRSEHEADLRFTHGIELMFTEGRKLKRYDPHHPRALTFAAVTFYASRELDARQWEGPLPFGLTFDDSQADLVQKVGVQPVEQEDDEEDLSGLAVWHFADFNLNVLYSNVYNRILRVTLMDPGFQSLM